MREKCKGENIKVRNFMFLYIDKFLEDDDENIGIFKNQSMRSDLSNRKPPMVSPELNRKASHKLNDDYHIAQNDGG